MVAAEGRPWDAGAVAGEKRRRLKGLLERGGRAALKRIQPAPEGPQEVRFADAGEGTIEAGATLLQAALALDVDLDHFCGGSCSCGTCRVEVVSGAEHLSRMKPSESIVLGHEAVQAGDRLACQARVLGPVEVRVPGFFMRGA